ncbi:hypothetical protein EV356DRAFT_83294 [Viridothelium virens]|uniref:DUF7770 domain-containing protein n=1 Tax=Viridothelium virens TaxID=1048519 RepID=A0A6A6HD89_VIRVR|nr:hypothetical protein EV356DRAFT_83294 [Viridothelium virens]
MSSWYTPPTFFPVKYVPADRKDEIRAKSVLCVHAVAHPKGPGPHPGGFTNHWCLYLQTGADESVEIDVQPNPQQRGTAIPGGSKADVIASLLPFPIFANAVHYKTMAVPAGLVVAQVLDSLVQHGHDKYEFTARGVGCRKWVDTLAFLTEKGWLDGSMAISDIVRLWPEGIPLELDEGKYYS